MQSKYNMKGLSKITIIIAIAILIIIGFSIVLITKYNKQSPNNTTNYSEEKTNNISSKTNKISESDLIISNIMLDTIQYDILNTTIYDLEKDNFHIDYDTQVYILMKLKIKYIKDMMDNILNYYLQKKEKMLNILYNLINILV